MKLEQAARQALECLNTLISHHTVCYLAISESGAVDAEYALREALEQPDEIDWIETNKALAKEIIELKKQIEQPVSQEPVAWLWCKDGKPQSALLHKPTTFPQDSYWQDKGFSAQPLYTAQQPVSQDTFFPDEPIAWERTQPGVIKYISQSRYEAFSPEVQKYYKPYRCSNCTEQPVSQEPVEQINYEEWEFNPMTGESLWGKQPVSQEPVAEVKVRPLRGYESTSKVDIEWRTRPTAGFLYTAQQPVSRAELKDAFQEGFNRAADLYAPQSVSQKPYAYEVWDEQDQSFTMIYASSLEEFHWIEKENIVTILYAAPVRTKDLTDDEIDEIFAEHGTIPNTKAVRSVIAADREKNK